jgi:uncharacterized membrane protein
MKRINLSYWIITGLFAGMMLLSGIFNALAGPESIEMVVNHLRYPDYFVPYIGVAKVLGAIALLIPGWPRVKEWAYFGFFLDLFSAIYSMIMVGDPISAWAPVLIGLALLFASYLLHHRRLNAAHTAH